MKNILCTGGTGFCGTWMQSTCPSEIDSAWFMNHNQYETRLWEDFDWDYIIHLAPISPSRVLKYAQKHQIKVLFASSGAIYEGRGEYAYHKRLWEAECVHSNVDVVIARLFATSGLPFQKNKALSIFIQNALAGKPLQVWGDGSTVRSYIYGEDIGRIFWDMLLNNESGAYDVGSVIPYTMIEIANMIGYQIPVNIEFIEHEEMPTPTRYLPKHPKYINDTIGLNDAIERMIENVSQLSGL